MSIETIKVLDKGYVKYIGHMGSDETFVEAARMSTGKGFLGWYWEEDTWASHWCGNCDTQHDGSSLPVTDDGLLVCTNCWMEGVSDFEEGESPEPEMIGRKGQRKDLGLLEYLYSNRHSTPFEMGELAIEVKAPIEVFRQWHRHRTQSYNEFSARYSQMPNEHYVPPVNRLALQKSTNKQANSQVKDGLWNTPELRLAMQDGIKDTQGLIYSQYERLLDSGVPKEVARINTPVSRYSKMRAKANIRNWLGFLGLRMDSHAQEEIRQYGNAVASIIKQLFPRTFELFLEWDLLGDRFSRTEMRVLRSLMLEAVELTKFHEIVVKLGLTPAQGRKLLMKFNTDKEALYKEVLEKL